MELKRNGGRGGYCATRAQAALSYRGASQRGHCDIAARPPLRDKVPARLRRGWSPEEGGGSAGAAASIFLLST